MSSPPAGVPLTGCATPRRRARLRRRAAILRWGAVALLVAAVGALAALAGAAELSGVQWLVAVPAGVLCPVLAALVAWAAARVSRREATERIWLAGTVLVVTDEIAGRVEYDLTVVPVSLGLRSLMARAGPRPVWAELRIGTDPVDRRILVLSDANSRRLCPVDELRALAAALERSPVAESRLAAGRLRTLVGWGSLAPLRGTEVDEIPVTSAGNAGSAGH